MNGLALNIAPKWRQSPPSFEVNDDEDYELPEQLSLFSYVWKKDNGRMIYRTGVYLGQKKKGRKLSKSAFARFYGAVGANGNILTQDKQCNINRSCFQKAMFRARPDLHVESVCHDEEKKEWCIIKRIDRKTGGVYVIYENTVDEVLISADPLVGIPSDGTTCTTSDKEGLDSDRCNNHVQNQGEVTRGVPENIFVPIRSPDNIDDMEIDQDNTGDDATNDGGYNAIVASRRMDVGMDAADGSDNDRNEQEGPVSNFGGDDQGNPHSSDSKLDAKSNRADEEKQKLTHDDNQPPIAKKKKLHISLNLDDSSEDDSTRIHSFSVSAVPDSGNTLLAEHGLDSPATDSTLTEQDKRDDRKVQDGASREDDILVQHEASREDESIDCCAPTELDRNEGLKAKTSGPPAFAINATDPFSHPKENDLISFVKDGKHFVGILFKIKETKGGIRYVDDNNFIRQIILVLDKESFRKGIFRSRPELVPTSTCFDNRTAQYCTLQSIEHKDGTVVVVFQGETRTRKIAAHDLVRVQNSQIVSVSVVRSDKLEFVGRSFLGVYEHPGIDENGDKWYIQGRLRHVKNTSEPTLIMGEFVKISTINNTVTTEPQEFCPRLQFGRIVVSGKQKAECRNLANRARLEHEKRLDTTGSLRSHIITAKEVWQMPDRDDLPGLDALVSTGAVRKDRETTDITQGGNIQASTSSLLREAMQGLPQDGLESDAFDSQDFECASLGHRRAKRKRGDDNNDSPLQLPITRNKRSPSCSDNSISEKLEFVGKSYHGVYECPHVSEDDGTKWFIRGRLRKVKDRSQPELMMGEFIKYLPLSHEIVHRELQEYNSKRQVCRKEVVSSAQIKKCKNLANKGEIEYAKNVHKSGARLAAGMNWRPDQPVVVVGSRGDGSLTKATIESAARNLLETVKVRINGEIFSELKSKLRLVTFERQPFDIDDFFQINPPASRQSESFKKEPSFVYDEWKKANGKASDKFESEFRDKVEARKRKRRWANGKGDGSGLTESGFNILKASCDELLGRLERDMNNPTQVLKDSDDFKKDIIDIKTRMPTPNLLLLCGGFAPDITAYKRLRAAPLGRVILQDIDLNAVGVAVAAHPDVHFCIAVQDSAKKAKTERPPGDVFILNDADVVQRIEAKIGGIHDVDITNPCISFSLAGKKDGFTDDKRNGLLLVDCTAVVQSIKESSDMPTYLCENVLSTTDNNERMNQYLPERRVRYFSACASMYSPSIRKRKFATNMPPAIGSSEPNQERMPPSLNGDDPDLLASSVVDGKRRMVHPGVKKIPCMTRSNSSQGNVIWEQESQFEAPIPSPLTPEEAERALGYKDNEIGVTKYSAVDAVRFRIENHNYAEEGALVSLKGCAEDPYRPVMELDNRTRLQLLGNSVCVTQLEHFMWNLQYLFPPISQD